MRAMTGPGLQRAGVSRLVGREPECTAIDGLLRDARAGMGGSLVVRGEAGIGKSALLGYARQRAAPMRVLSAVGVQAESDLAFAGLHELLRPVLMYLGELPGTQSQALAGALGLAPARRTGCSSARRCSACWPPRPRPSPCCAWSTTRNGWTGRPPTRWCSPRG